MGVRRIAFAIGEPLLLTLDGETLFGFDAADGSSKWQLRFEETLAGVVYTSIGALPIVDGGSPWRTRSSTSSIAIVLDVAGGVHVVDAGTGARLGELEPAGPPVALAAAADALAIATASEVFVYREGARTALPFRATALAFSRDGSTLAMGTKSEVVLVKMKLPPIAKARIRGPVTDLAARPGGGWLVGTGRGVHALASDGGKGTGAIEDITVSSLALDRAGRGVAIMRSSLAAVIFEWPDSTPTRRIFAEEPRAIEDVAFAEAGILAVALDSGEACIVNLATSSVLRTKPAAGRTQRDGGVRIEDGQPAPESEPPEPPARSLTGSRLGGGALVAIVLFVMRLVLLSSSRSTHPTIQSAPILDSLTRCDQVCERGRLTTLRDACARAPEPICLASAEDALQLFEDRQCDEAQDALRSIRKDMSLGDAGVFPVVRELRLAEIGLRTACVESAPAETAPD